MLQEILLCIGRDISIWGYQKSLQKLLIRCICLDNVETGDDTSIKTFNLDMIFWGVDAICGPVVLTQITDIIVNDEARPITVKFTGMEGTLEITAACLRYDLNELGPHNLPQQMDLLH
jgi:hypothetical protein